MKNINIVKELEKMGFKVNYGKFEYWDNIPYVSNKNQEKTFLVETETRNGSFGLIENLKLKEVLSSIENAEYCVNRYRNTYK